MLDDLKKLHAAMVAAGETFYAGALAQIIDDYTDKPEPLGPLDKPPLVCDYPNIRRRLDLEPRGFAKRVANAALASTRITGVKDHELVSDRSVQLDALEAEDPEADRQRMLADAAD